jgi:hypothetical protein
MKPYVPCDSCRVNRCVGETLTREKALWAWAEDGEIKCSDYEPVLYHGVEGVVCASCMDSIYDRYVSRGHRRNNGYGAAGRFEYR